MTVADRAAIFTLLLFVVVFHFPLENAPWFVDVSALSPAYVYGAYAIVEAWGTLKDEDAQ